ncbi:hypothetical protein ANCCAN_16350 [Ancylostoma caninum]|uniref:Uncharacterized protein n=1 Tax=Ancylostoma caninum TaxID=29170 RepID=A0A368G544_ANCCA|nr:hypothetical protein ANCCAN_16350 [Ancylostoma caninum]
MWFAFMIRKQEERTLRSQKEISATNILKKELMRNQESVRSTGMLNACGACATFWKKGKNRMLREAFYKFLRDYSMTW